MADAVYLRNSFFWLYRRLSAFIGGKILFLVLGPIAMTGADAQDGFAVQRKAMVGTVAALTRETQAETGRASLSDRVMAAMEKVPRHRFVPQDLAAHAYANRPLPIGNGQTISQPFIVALMTDLLDLKPTDRVLEIGTGCGYQAAVLGDRARGLHHRNCRAAGEGSGGAPGDVRLSQCDRARR